MRGPIVVLGCGGHSRSVADVLLANDASERIIFLDENARENERLFGFPVVGTLDLAPFERIFLALGDNQRRARAYDGIDLRKLVTIVSPSAYVSATATVGAGCFLAHGAHVGPFSRVGDDTIVNTGAVLDHEVDVGKHCHVGPNATVSGRTVIGDRVFVGVGATVVDGMKICDDVTIGAGGVVVDHIREPGTYVGVPARRLPR
jgi:sugar O-acyltransferase (sialic acid O-acetyltransferase NeuD family)